jgi:Flp pilus assembly protein TadG
VEFAIVLSLFLAGFLYGLFEISRAIQVLQVMTNAARAGCREGAQSGKGNTDITTAISAVMTANGLTSYETPSITVSDPNNTGNTTDAGSANSGSQVSVQVSMKAQNFSWVGSYFFLKSAAKGGSDTIVYSQTLTMRKQ